MSQSCPLCGKNKAEEALFCGDCTKKIKSDYEVDIPETPVGNGVAPVEPAPDVAETPPITAAAAHPKPKRKKRPRTLLWLLFAVILAVGAFFFYMQFVREANLERAEWHAATAENTPESYIAYMEKFPNGARYAQADSLMRALKNAEVSAWEKMKHSDNTAELRDFVRLNPQSAYNPLVKIRLDSLTWAAALNQNTAESYSEYMMLSQSGEFGGDYFAEAQQRYEMLFQSYPVNAAELDSIKLSVEGFYAALSSVSYEGVTAHLAPTVNRFFNSGAASRERIVGELMMAAAQSQEGVVKFSPNIQALQYEKTFSGGFNANVPLIKTYQKEGREREVSGYIVHFGLNPQFQIVGVYETAPPYAD